MEPMQLSFLLKTRMGNPAYNYIYLSPGRGARRAQQLLLYRYPFFVTWFTLNLLLRNYRTYPLLYVHFPTLPPHLLLHDYLGTDQVDRQVGSLLFTIIFVYLLMTDTSSCFCSCSRDGIRMYVHLIKKCSCQRSRITLVVYEQRRYYSSPNCLSIYIASVSCKHPQVCLT